MVHSFSFCGWGGEGGEREWGGGGERDGLVIALLLRLRLDCFWRFLKTARDGRGGGEGGGVCDGRGGGEGGGVCDGRGGGGQAGAAPGEGFRELLMAVSPGGRGVWACGAAQCISL